MLRNHFGFAVASAACLLLVAGWFGFYVHSISAGRLTGQAHKAQSPHSATVSTADADNKKAASQEVPIVTKREPETSSAANNDDSGNQVEPLKEQLAEAL